MGNELGRRGTLGLTLSLSHQVNHLFPCIRTEKYLRLVSDTEADLEVRQMLGDEAEKMQLGITMQVRPIVGTDSIR